MSVDIILVIQVHSWCNTTSCVESAETLQIYSTTIYIYIFLMESMDNCRWKVQINVTHIHTFNPIALRTSKTPRSFCHSECSKIKDA